MPRTGRREMAETTSAKHFGIGSICRKMKGSALWACSSAGRAPALQAGGQGFESPHVHQPSVCNFNYLLIWPFRDFCKLGNIWEQLIFQLLDGVPLGARAGVRVDFKRGRQVRMP